jgi:molecular chaperone GrpE (heat shock protein)
MRKKFVILSLILGLILFLTGAAALRWVLTEREKEKQLLQERQQRFDAGWDKLDRVVTGEIDVQSFANIAPRENRQRESDKYKARTERMELVLVVSIVCMFIGGMIFSWLLLLWTARLLIRGLSYLAKFSTNVFRRHRKIGAKQLANAKTGEDKETSEQEQKLRGQQRQLKKHSKVLADSGWYNLGTNFANQYEPAPLEKVLSMRSGPLFNNSSKDGEKASALPSGEKSVGFMGFSKPSMENLNAGMMQSNQLCKTISKATLSDSQENYPGLEDLLKTQTDNLEKQMEEFGRMARSVQQAALEHSEPLKNSLGELIQQVSAIREYALQQQGRMEKLQDGYDWNIIRTFCLRVIRCIDNLENRIARLSRENIDTTDLEQVRDELIFALESSGVERFELEINSDYRGQERKAEAVKGRKRTDDRNLTGKIAKVVRPGYQYVINEENVKVVRTARVKLFG